MSPETNRLPDTPERQKREKVRSFLSGLENMDNALGNIQKNLKPDNVGFEALKGGKSLSSELTAASDMIDAATPHLRDAADILEGELRTLDTTVVSQVVLSDPEMEAIDETVKTPSTLRDLLHSWGVEQIRIDDAIYQYLGRALQMTLDRGSPYEDCGLYWIYASRMSPALDEIMHGRIPVGGYLDSLENFETDNSLVEVLREQLEIFQKKLERIKPNEQDGNADVDSLEFALFREGQSPEKRDFLSQIWQGLGAEDRKLIKEDDYQATSTALVLARVLGRVPDDEIANLAQLFRRSVAFLKRDS